MDTWNGVSLSGDTEVSLPIYVLSDTSGSWGCGTLKDNKWLIFQWSEPLRKLNCAKGTRLICQSRVGKGKTLSQKSGAVQQH